MTSTSVLDAKLQIKLDLSFTPAVTSSFQGDSTYKSHFVNQLFLFDSVVIPTHDMAIVAVLFGWFGAAGLEQLLDQKAVRFLRQKHMIGYVGNGVGLAPFRISLGEKRPRWDYWWDEAMFGDSTILSADLQLRNLCGISDPARSRLLDQISAVTQDVDEKVINFHKDVAHESYTDIMESPELSAYAIELSDSSADEIDLARLNGVEPNSLKCLGPHLIRHAHDLVLKVAELNMQLKMAGLAQTTDIAVDGGAPNLLREKLRRSGLNAERTEGFGRIVHLAGVPDIGAAVSQGRVSLEEILELRASPDAKRFRQWIASANPRDATALEQLYVASLAGCPITSTLPGKVVRFASTSVLGMLDPIPGIVAGAIDSFFAESWLRGYRPKLFLDKLCELAARRASENSAAPSRTTRIIAQHD